MVKSVCNNKRRYGDFTGTLLYEDFSSSRRLYGDSSLWRLFLFTETLRGLFSMETFPLHGDFTGTLLYGDFSSSRRLYGVWSYHHSGIYTMTRYYKPRQGSELVSEDCKMTSPMQIWPVSRRNLAGLMTESGRSHDGIWLVS